MILLLPPPNLPLGKGEGLISAPPPCQGGGQEG
jgi:hypothetical protein